MAFTRLQGYRLVIETPIRHHATTESPGFGTELESD